MICLLLGHKFGRAFSRGKRNRRTGMWTATGPDYQTCCACGAERESPIQFGVIDKQFPEIEEARPVRARAA